MLKTSTIIMAAVAVFGTSQLASAQGHYGYGSNTHYDNVPHTTTHADYVRHGNHVDAVPHTTTHVDRVPHTTYRTNNGWNQQSNYVPRTINYFNRVQQYRPRYVPHTTTHYDSVRHGNHFDSVPHTTTHYDRH